MNTEVIAKQIAEKYKFKRAEKYDLAYRDFDNMVEVIGYIQDPTSNMKEYEGREMLFPKRWVTLGVVYPEHEEIAV
jgi:hypothetical protein